MTFSYKPLVSIVINCFNGEKYLDQSINSVLHQTYENWEIIFWDNLSVDKSSDIVDGYIKQDKRIKKYLAKEHTLLYKARKLALPKCSGEIICFLDVDDWWHTNKLERQIEILKDKNIGLVYSNFDLYNQTTNKYKSAFKFFLPSGNILKSLLNSYCVGLSTIALRSKILHDESITFDDSFNIIGDFDLVIQIAKKYKIFAIQDPLVYIRKHTESVSFNSRELYSIEMNRWINKSKNNSALSNSNFSNLENTATYSLAISHILSGNKKKALKLLINLKTNIQFFKIILMILTPLNLVKYLNKI